MKLIKVGVGVLNQTPMAWESNKANILGAVEWARRERITVLCLPELCITGYGLEDAFHSPHVTQVAAEILAEIAVETKGVVVSLGLPIIYRNALYNAACLIADRRILGFTPKRHLAADGLYYEPRWFRPWPEGVVRSITIAGRDYPIGDVYFECGGVKIGFEICEDAWVAKRPGATLSARGVDIILNPSASHFAFGKSDIRRRFVLEGSRSFGVTYLYSNLLGNESGRAIYDGGGLIASAGQLLAAGPRFTFTEFLVTSAVVDINATRLLQMRTGSYAPDLEEDESGCVRVNFSFPSRDPVPRRPKVSSWEISRHHKEEEFSRAVALGLIDYLRKSRAHGFAVSLSGGADSSAVACLVASMVRLALQDLGLEALLKKLEHIPEIDRARTANEIVHLLLTCVYQSTENSSERTREAAREVATSIGAQYLEFDVDAMCKSYVTLVSKSVGRELTWERDDVALQNIQARARGPGIWLLANLGNLLLLPTSNRSEAAVGYATMDGDTCGCLDPIGGIDKAFLRSWLRWLETDGPEGVDPIPQLSLVNNQAPTAELRPASATQTDEDDLMPYGVLDAIERAAIRDKKSPLDVFKLMRSQFDYPKDQLGQWIEKFFKLWCRNQWKRERYAPSFHLDDENLDPKTWCRFPILSGNYERELSELRAYLQGRPPGS